MGAHGFPRATKDVDIVPAPDDGNLDRLADVLRVIEAHNFGTGDFDPAEFPFDPRKPDDLREGGNFVLATRLGCLDIMQWVPGIPGDLAFEHLTRAAVMTSLGSRPVRVCSREDLIAMKRAAGRSRIFSISSSSASPDPRRHPRATSGLCHDRACVHPRSFVSRDA